MHRSRLGLRGKRKTATADASSILTARPLTRADPFRHVGRALPHIRGLRVKSSRSNLELLSLDVSEREPSDVTPRSSEKNKLESWRAFCTTEGEQPWGKLYRWPKSYRPVSLLPVMGKIVEKAINIRLQEQKGLNLSGKQYGFTKGKSTHAVENLLTWSALRPEKNVITVLLDITGAFDNLAWPALQSDLQELGATQHMQKWISEYLYGRTSTMAIGGVTKTVRVTKGCPQRSILGPVLWILTMEAPRVNGLRLHTGVCR